MTKNQHANLPYRPCVGVMLLNPHGRVWIGHRIVQENDDEAAGVGMWWQMPQGGIDEGEDVRTAAMRELTEETGVRSATILAETEDWFTYDLPDHLVGVAELPTFTVDRAADLEPGGLVLTEACDDPGSEGAKGVKSLAARPLRIRSLKVPCSDVVAACDAEDVLPRPFFRNRMTAPADDQSQLALVFDL